MSHLLLRGEQPEILTGYNLMSTIYGNVTYVPRTIYANREDMLKNYARSVAGNSGSVLWFSDIIHASSTAESSTSPNFMQMDASRSEGNHLQKILVVNEGAGDSVALLGNGKLKFAKQQCISLGSFSLNNAYPLTSMICCRKNFMKMFFLCIGIIRLVQYLSQNHLLGKQKAVKFVVDAGTGTTAIGIGLAAIFLGCGSVCIMLV